jgi:hypothetical protein
VIGEEGGYLGEGEDEDQVEEQLEGGDALLAPVPGSQQISVIGNVLSYALSLAWPTWQRGCPHVATRMFYAPSEDRSSRARRTSENTPSRHSVNRA